MNTTKSIFLALSIILFAIGLWPIAIITGTVYITLAIISSIQQKKEIKELKDENQKLQQELQNQAVRRAMDKAEGREKE